MDYVTHRISLDIHNTSSQALLRVKQGETSRRLLITLREGGQPYEIADGCTANLSAIKPDGNSIYNHCEIEGDTIIYTFTEQTTMAVGMVNCEIILNDSNNNKTTTPHFTILVEEGLFSGDEVMSTPEATVLDALVDRATAATEAAENVVDEVKQYARNNFANAFDGYAEGAIIRVDDVSPVEHGITCRLSSDGLTDFSSVKVSRYGKNLLPIIQNQTLNGVTISYTSDGCYHLDGTCTLSHNFVSPSIVLGGGIYTLSANNPSHNGLTSYLIQFYSVGSGEGVYIVDNVTNGEATAELNYGNDYVLRIRIQEGITYNNFVIRPQLEFGAKKTEFEPYINPVTYAVDTDGTVESITSLSPYMTIFTDTADTIISCEYNKDSNKVAKGLYDFIVQETSAPTKVSSVTLLASGWEGDASPYSQAVSIPGITENSMVDLTPSVEQLAVFHNKDLAFVTENVDGEVTVYAIGQKPENDYTMPVAITEVKA